jgi:GTP-binding protein HflX
MALLRLDAMVVINVHSFKVHLAWLLPENPEEKKWEITEWNHVKHIDIPCASFISSLENDIARQHKIKKAGKGEEQAILVHVGPESAKEAERSLSELASLAETAGVDVLDTTTQRISRLHPAHLLGKGKLKNLLIRSLYLGATMIIFDRELSPVQANNIARMMELKILDRTQLILDIFAKRARTRSGKMQVELAQLKYMLPRLTGRGTAMSRLMGGIGGKGPGETKLEVDRRRINARIASLEKSIKILSKERKERRKKRQRGCLPIVSIIGYTNAGKSTLLNRLTGSSVTAENMLFATLDPTTRRYCCGEGVQILLSDTVGFIKFMPSEIKTAFRATLEELDEADIFIHVIDVSSPYMKDEKETVEEILSEMGLLSKPRIIVYNKADVLSNDTFNEGLLPDDGFIVSVKTGYGLDMLKEEITKKAVLYSK